MDLQKFEIIVNAMLGWSDEAKAPRKTPGRAPSRFALEDEDDDDIIDDELAPEEELPSFPKASTASADVDEDEDEDETV